MPVNIDELQRMLDEWLASLPFWKRLEIKAGLFAAGYTTLGGKLRLAIEGTPKASISCLLVAFAVLIAFLISLAVTSCH